MDTKEPKRRIQAKIDADTADQVDDVLRRLGLSPSTLVNALYKRVAAEHRIPFELELTPREVASSRLADAAKDVRAETATTQEELDRWLTESGDR